MGQMIQLNFSRFDLFGQFACFNCSNDQVGVCFLQHNHVFVGRCLFRLCRANFPLARGGSFFTQVGSIFTQMRGIFSVSGQFLAA